ncbi:DUF1080 domain-containing protein [Pirellulales bacterium]|nr:DUF1080 domain-containing protein [Pirellulales bacterium]
MIEKSCHGSMLKRPIALVTASWLITAWLLPASALRADHHHDWVDLLEGGDLSEHWVSAGNWILDDDGVVTLHPRPGEEGWGRFASYLWLKGVYQDFQFEFDYQVEPAGNSGFYFHVADKMNPVQDGIELQIRDSHGKAVADLNDHDSGGIIPAEIAPTQSAAKPAGQWNHFHVECRDKQLTAKLNGVVVNVVNLKDTLVGNRAKSGYIGFQDHGMFLALRNLRIKGLDHERNKAITPRESVIRLFDGKSLDPFYTWLSDTKFEDPRNVYRVEDGMIHISGDGLGGLLTKQQYRDYHLVLEYKWGKRTWGARKDRAKDSGVLVHSRGAHGGYGGNWMPSIELNIMQGTTGDCVLVVGNDEEGQPVPLSLTCEVERDRDGEVVWKKGGERETFNPQNNPGRINWVGRDVDFVDVTGFRGKDDVASPDGEWTRMDLFCDGGHILTYVNGTVVNEGFDAFPTYGKIQIQSELAEVYYRRLELWPLDKGPTPAPAEK